MLALLFVSYASDGERRDVHGHGGDNVSLWEEAWAMPS